MDLNLGNLETANRDAKTLQVFAPGIYNMQIYGAKLVDTTKADGKRLILYFMTEDKQHRTKIALNIINPSVKCQEYGQTQLKQICQALGLQSFDPLNLEMLYNKTISVVLEVQPAEGKYPASQQFKKAMAIQSHNMNDFHKQLAQNPNQTMVVTAQPPVNNGQGQSIPLPSQVQQPTPVQTSGTHTDSAGNVYIKTIDSNGNESWIATQAMQNQPQLVQAQTAPFQQMINQPAPQSLGDVLNTGSGEN